MYKALRDMMYKEVNMGISLGQVQTERGLLHVSAICKTAEMARTLGYDLAWHSSKLKGQLYSKCLDNEGYRHDFVFVPDTQ